MERRHTLFAAVFALLALPAAAQDRLEDVLSHRVIPGWMQQDGSYIAGIEITLAKGWKTYWRSPGDAGIPPTFDWSRAQNIGNVHIHWPSPEVFWQSGMRSLGYSERVVLPISVTPNRKGRNIHLRGRMDLGICSDVCIPASVSIDAALDPSSDVRAPALVAALAQLPYTRDEAGVRRAVCRFAPSDQGLTVTASLTLPSAGGLEEAVIEPPRPGIWVSEAKTRRSDDVLTVTAEMVDYAGATLDIDRSDIRITVIGSNYSVDVKGCTGS